MVEPRQLEEILYSIYALPISGIAYTAFKKIFKSINYEVKWQICHCMCA